MKKFRLIALTKEILKHASINTDRWFTLMKSVLIKHTKLRKEKYKMYGSRVKGSGLGGVGGAGGSVSIGNRMVGGDQSEAHFGILQWHSFYKLLSK